jgi:hypothetical protein
MTDTDEREAAWFAIHEALPPFWHVAPVTYDPGIRAWQVSAVGRHPGRGKIPQSVTGTGDDEIAALRDLDDKLRGRPRPAEEAAQRAALERRLRLAFYLGVEEWWQEKTGEPIGVEPLRGALDRYPRRS